MEIKLEWDEAKRYLNLIKHGLDFADAGEVLDSRFRLDIKVVRSGELRVQAGLSGGADGGAYRARWCSARHQLSAGEQHRT